MRIDRLELRLLRLPLVHFFETSFGRIYDKHFLLVVLGGEGATGFGECVAEADPYYGAETNETCWHIITGYLAPRVLGASFAHPRDVFPAFRAVRGHHMAKAAVEMAAWDLYARQQGLPLARVLGGTRREIASGVSIGIQDSLDQLVENGRRVYYQNCVFCHGDNMAGEGLFDQGRKRPLPPPAPARAPAALPA